MIEPGLPQVSPERTFALVVGVERYEVSPAWNLPGAARDALRFARWLTGPAGVPPGNLRLFLSPLPTADLDWTGPVAELESRCEEATEAGIKMALLNDLPGRDGDLLWIFWAGHGFQADNQDQLLPYADATVGQPLDLNLRSALGWWSSDKVPSARFRLQAVLVDACRVDPPSGKQLTFPINDYGRGSTVPGRRQFQLYASSPGEAAKSLAARQAGQLTEVLLDRLDDLSLEQSVPRLDAIADSVKARFAELREQNLAWQTPQIVLRQGWDGSTVITDPLLDRPLAPRLTDEDWSGLEELFRGRQLPEYSWEAYCWAFELTECELPPSRSLPTGGVMKVLADLNGREGAKSGIPLVVPFVRYLADRTRQTDPQRSTALDDWATQTRARMGVPALPPPPPTVPEGVLHVRIKEATAEQQFFAEIWLHYQDAFELLWETEQDPQELAVIRGALADQLVAVTHRFRGETADSAVQLVRVEFHLPRGLLDTGPALDAEFDRWPIPVGASGKRRELGQRYQVVLRCPEERADLDEEPWWRKWRWFKAEGGQNAQAVRLIGDVDLTDELPLLLGAEDPPICVLAEVSDSTTLVDTLIEAGMPIAVWRRGGPPPTGAADEGLRVALTPEPGDSAPFDVYELPARLRALRMKHGPAPGRPESWRHPLVLLWDDPTRRPHTQSLTGNGSLTE